jgi:hypothetical protein
MSPTRSHLLNGLLFLASALVGFWITLGLRQVPVRTAPMPMPTPLAMGRGRENLRPDLTSSNQRTPPSLVALPSSAERPTIEVPQTLSVFQEASLEHPDRARRLSGELIMSLHEPYKEALRCYSGPDRAELEYRFRIRSRGLTASVLGSSFVRVKRGVPLDPQTIDCINRALNKPFEIFTRSEAPFLEDLEVDVPVGINLEVTPSNQTPGSSP